MIMKPKSKKFCFAKLLVFGLLMLALQLASFAGDLPVSLEVLEEADQLEIAEAPYSEYAQLYSYTETNDSPFGTTFTYHESLILGLGCIAAVIAGNFRSKTVAKTVATGLLSFTVLNFGFHLAFALIDSSSWYTPYSLMECTPFLFGIMTTAIAGVIGILAFFADPVVDVISKKVEEKRWAAYNERLAAERKEKADSEAAVNAATAE
ncbi:MAG: hypothetical protein IIW79_02010 [Clostridia bacterium]|nr:hypothetical protein [Clostridia bacterium]